MASVAIHPPKTPVTKGSMGIAKATIPNICKMPGPPAPFVPSPLPNIAKSGMSPKGYSTTVKIEGNTVAIRGATFKSMGDMASKGTGGGLISANTHGPAKFITPGSLTVKIQGKSVHLLSEPMLNNLGASGMPPNTGATMMGLGQQSADARNSEPKWGDILRECGAGEPPSDMTNPHAHHVVFKKGRGKEMRQHLAKSKAILDKHEIDWYEGCENLVWAPNKNHSTRAAKAVSEALEKADKVGTREAVVNTLKALGKKFANGTI